MSGSVDNRSSPHTPQASAPPSALSVHPAAPSSSAYATSSLETNLSKVDDSPGGCASCFACFIQAIKNFIAWICSCCFGAPDKPEAEDGQHPLPQGSQPAPRQDLDLPVPPPALSQAPPPEPAAPLPRLPKVPGVLPMTALKNVLEDITQALTEEQVQGVIDGLKKDVLTPQSFKELFEIAAGRACGAKAYPDKIKDGSVPLMALMKNYELFFCGDNQNSLALVSYQLQVAMVESESADQLERFINDMDPAKRILLVFKGAYSFAKQLIDIGKEMALDVLLKNRSLFPLYQSHFPEFSKRAMDKFLSDELTNFREAFPSGPSTKTHAALLTIVGKHAPEANELLLFVIEKGIEHRGTGSLLGSLVALVRGENPANYREPYDLCLDVVKGLLEAPTTVINPEIAIAMRPLCFHLARHIESNRPVGEPAESERHNHHRMQQTADYCRDLLCALVASQKVNVLATASGEHAISSLAVRCDRVSLDRMTALRPEVFDPLAFQDVSLLIDNGLSLPENPDNAYEMAYRHGRLFHPQRFQIEAIRNLRQFIASYVPAARAILQGRNEALQTHFPNQDNPLRDLVISYLTPVSMRMGSPTPPAMPQSAPISQNPS